MAYRRTTEDEKAEIVRLYTEERMPSPAIAEKFDMTPVGIRNILRAKGVTVVAGAMKRAFGGDPEKEQKFAELAGEIGIESAGKKMGLSAGGSFKLARRLGVYIPDSPTEWHRTKELRDDSFSLPISPAAAYWAGMLMADGAITLDPKGERSPTISLDLGKLDRGVVTAFKEFLGSGHDVQYGHRGESARLQVRSTRLASDLAVLGVSQKKTSREVAGPAVANSVDFWRGVVDGDGCFNAAQSKDGYRWAVLHLCGSKEILLQFREFVCNTLKINMTNTTSWNNGTFQMAAYGKVAVPLIRAMLAPGDTALLTHKKEDAIRVLAEFGGRP